MKLCRDRLRNYLTLAAVENTLTGAGDECNAEESLQQM